MTCTAGKKPQFLYIGVVDAAKLRGKNTIETKDCYILNTSGRAWVPETGMWNDYDEHTQEALQSAELFSVSIDNAGLRLMCDHGRTCTMFPQVPKDWRVVLGLFGTGSIVLRLC